MQGGGVSRGEEWRVANSRLRMKTPPTQSTTQMLPACQAGGQADRPLPRVEYWNLLLWFAAATTVHNFSTNRRSAVTLILAATKKPSRRKRGPSGQFAYESTRRSRRDRVWDWFAATVCRCCVCGLCIGLVSEALSKDIKTHLQQMAKNNCGKLLLEMKTFSEEFAKRCKTNNEYGECCKLRWGMIDKV